MKLLALYVRYYTLGQSVMTLLVSAYGMYLSLSQSLLTGILSYFLPPANFIIGAVKLLTGVNLLAELAKLTN